MNEQLHGTATLAELAGPTRDSPAPIELGFDSPFPGRPWNSHGFVGAWSLSRPLRVSGRDLDDASSGKHWFMLAAGEPGAGERVHYDRASGVAVAFDGYVVDPPLHQRSAPRTITSFWGAQRNARVNGHFAAAVVDETSGDLALRTDAFGFAALYYRVVGDVVLFGTCPDYLVSDDSTPDYTGLSSLLRNGMLPGNRTLFEDVRRVPLGGALTFSGTGGEPVTTRFDLESMGSGSEPLTTERVDHLDAMLRQAVDRCLELDYSAPLVTLSSGDDCRRILGALLDAGQRPASLTRRIFQKGDRDLDATFGGQIARACDLPHRLIDMPDAETSAHLNALRRRALGAETTMHDTALVLLQGLPSAPTAVFQGFLGDAFHVPGYRWEGVFEDPGADLEHVAGLFAEGPYFRMLSAGMNRNDQIGETLRAYLADYAGQRHAADLAWLALRQRRTVGIGGQLLQPRHLLVRPYVDLDYMRAALDIDPRAKLHTDVRRKLLERHHPELAAFPGSSNRPETLDPVPETGNAARNRTYMARIARDLPWRVQQNRFAELLSPAGRMLAAMTRIDPHLTERWFWGLRPIFEAGLHYDRTPPVWRFG